MAEVIGYSYKKNLSKSNTFTKADRGWVNHLGLYYTPPEGEKKECWTGRANNTDKGTDRLPCTDYFTWTHNKKTMEGEFYCWFSGNDRNCKLTIKSDNWPAGTYEVYYSVASHHDGSNWLRREDHIRFYFELCKSFFVKYDGNGATSGSMDTSQFAFSSHDAYIPSSEFSKSQHAFSAWNTSADGSGTQYSGGDAAGWLSSTDGATVTLYAMWSPINATVYVHDMDGNIREQFTLAPGASREFSGESRTSSSEYDRNSRTVTVTTVTSWRSVP